MLTRKSSHKHQKNTIHKLREKVKNTKASKQKPTWHWLMLVMDSTQRKTDPFEWLQNKYTHPCIDTKAIGDPVSYFFCKNNTFLSHHRHHATSLQRRRIPITRWNANRRIFDHKIEFNPFDLVALSSLSVSSPPFPSICVHTWIGLFREIDANL